MKPSNLWSNWHPVCELDYIANSRYIHNHAWYKYQQIYSNIIKYKCLKKAFVTLCRLTSLACTQLLCWRLLSFAVRVTFALSHVWRPSAASGHTQTLWVEWQMSHLRTFLTRAHWFAAMFAEAKGITSINALLACWHEHEHTLAHQLLNQCICLDKHRLMLNQCISSVRIATNPQFRRPAFNPTFLLCCQQLCRVHKSYFVPRCRRYLCWQFFPGPAKHWSSRQGWTLQGDQWEYHLWHSKLGNGKHARTLNPSTTFQQLMCLNYLTFRLTCLHSQPPPQGFHKNTMPHNWPYS